MRYGSSNNQICSNKHETPLVRLFCLTMKGFSNSTFNAFIQPYRTQTG